MEEKSDLTKNIANYPLNEAGILAEVEKYAPTMVERFRELEAPGISNRPNDLEMWE